jgi:hypothetical protein
MLRIKRNLEKLMAIINLFLMIQIMKAMIIKNQPAKNTKEIEGYGNY